MEKQYNTLIVVMIIVIVALAGFNIWQYTQFQELKVGMNATPTAQIPQRSLTPDSTPQDSIEDSTAPVFVPAEEPSESIVLANGAIETISGNQVTIKVAVTGEVATYVVSDNTQLFVRSILSDEEFKKKMDAYNKEVEIINAENTNLTEEEFKKRQAAGSFGTPPPPPLQDFYDQKTSLSELDLRNGDTVNISITVSPEGVIQQELASLAKVE